MADCPVPYPYSFKYAHPSLFADWYLAVSRIRGFAPVVKIQHSDPSLGRRIRTIGELEQVFEPCRMMLKGLKGGGVVVVVVVVEEALFCQEKKNTKSQ
jgi:hypothetical protein